MTYKEVKPDKALREFIHSYWSFEIDSTLHKKPFQHTALVDGCTSLIFSQVPNQDRKEPVFWGPSTQNFEVEVHPGAVYTGVRFMPSQTNVLFGMAGIELRDQALGAGIYLKDLDVQQIWECIENRQNTFIKFDEIFSCYVSTISTRQNHAILSTVQHIMDYDGNISLNELVAASPMSKRHLQRQFKKWVGLTIKEFCRVRRIRETVYQIMIAKQSDPGLVHQKGYYDRAHFNHEFSLMIRQTPSEYQQYIDEIVHRIDSN